MKTLFLMLPHPLNKFETKVLLKWRTAKFKLRGVYLRNNLPETKDGTYIMNLDEYRSIETHWIALDVDYDNLTYFDSWVHSKRNLKIHRKQKYHHKYSYNTSIWFNNVWILWYWFDWFYVE